MCFISHRRLRNLDCLLVVIESLLLDCSRPVPLLEFAHSLDRFSAFERQGSLRKIVNGSQEK